MTSAASEALRRLAKIATEAAAAIDNEGKTILPGLVVARLAVIGDETANKLADLFGMLQPPAKKSETTLFGPR